MALRFFCYSFMRVRETAEIVEDIAAMVAASQRFERKSAMMLFVFVPTAALAEVLASVDRRYVKVAAQDVASPHSCEIAGELSLARLRLLGADMALAGSLDRRIALGETHETVAAKMEVLLHSGLKSVLGIGELAGSPCGSEGSPELDGRLADEAIGRQIASAFASVPEDAYYRMGAVYQHAWSMGADGLAAPRSYVEERLSAIRAALREAVPRSPIDVPVFYGGRMSDDEAVSYLGEGMFDGILVDDRQKDVRSFCSIIERVCG